MSGKMPAGAMHGTAAHDLDSPSPPPPVINYYLSVAPRVWNVR